MKSAKKNTSLKLTVDRLYFILSLVLIIVSVTLILLSKGESYKYLLWHGKTLGYYPDLFESVIQAGTGKPYELGAIYPAFTYCLISVFYYFIPGEYSHGFDDLEAICSNTQTFVTAHLFYTLITLTIAYYIVRMFGKIQYKGKYLTVFIFITSSPFMFLIERGNTLIITLAFLIIYFFYYDSKNKYLRELALICLACAAAMKMYPAVFGLTLLTKKRYNQAFRAVIYGLILFLAPFFLMGGIDEIFAMFYNSFSLSARSLAGVTGFGYGFKINTTNIYAWLTDNNNTKVVRGIIYAFSVCLLLLSILIKEDWKRISAQSVAIILIPDFSYIYNAVYLLIPLCLFIKEKRGKSLNFLDVIYTLCFIGAFAPMPWGDINHATGGYNNMNWGTLICSVCILLLGIVIFADTISKFKKREKVKSLE